MSWMGTGHTEKWTWHGRWSRPTPFSLMWFYVLTSQLFYFIYFIYFVCMYVLIWYYILATISWLPGILRARVKAKSPVSNRSKSQMMIEEAVVNVEICTLHIINIM